LSVFTFKVVELHLRISRNRVIVFLNFGKVGTDELIINDVSLTKSVEINFAFVGSNLNNVRKN
jgi:hypothetical protein